MAPTRGNRGLRRIALGGIAALALSAVAPSAAHAEESEESPGRTAFIALKCHVCHAVETADIAAKTKNDKLKGPELSSVVGERERELTERYMRRTEKLEGKLHKKEFKGTDEELQAIIDWLYEQADVAAAGGSAGS